jgi:5-methylcytosine-specific restriction endonuclease McrA
MGQKEFRAWYRNVYLPSEHWQQPSADFRRFKNFTCEKCGGRGWDVHHRTYKNLGHESADELMLLCRPCHDRIHEPSMRQVEADLDRFQAAWLRPPEL